MSNVTTEFEIMNRAVCRGRTDELSSADVAFSITVPLLAAR
jgi:hypothetical protein